MGRLIPTDKPWGWTVEIAPNIEYALIQEGGTSSWHRHRKYRNRFYVVSGILAVICEVGGTHELKAGDVYRCEANNWHSFKALTDVFLIEVYDEPDIEREKLS